MFDPYIFIGIDPDLHNTGIAVVDSTGRVITVECVSVAASLRADHAVVAMSGALVNAMRFYDQTYAINTVAIEGQTISFRQTRDPNSIIQLAHVTGCAVSAVRAHCICAILIPTPAKWKGQVPKHIHHERICKKVGWDCEIHGSKAGRYGVPTNAQMGTTIKTGQWKHALDAVGLALWAQEKHACASRAKRALGG